MKIHGECWPVKAEAHNLESLSAHGDYNEILQWLGASNLNPQKAHITHGEGMARDVMRERVRNRLGPDVDVADLLEQIDT